MPKLEKTIKVVSLIVLITIVVKLLGFLRIVLMAKVFGTGIEASAFEAAYRIPDLLFTSIGVALSTTFIPIFTEYLSKRNKEEAIIFANNVINVLFFLTLVVSVIGIMFAPYIVKFIYWGFEGDIYYLTVHLVRIMFPVIIFIALSFAYVGILQSFGEFNIPAAISLPANIINILYLILLSSIFGVYGFAIAVLLGWSTQLFFQVPSLKTKGYKYSPVFSFKHEGLRKMFIMVIPIILGTSVQQINVLVNSALASGLGNSAIAALAYGNYLYIIIAGVFTYAISAVIFPSLSKLYAEQNHNEFKDIINKALKAIVFILAPIMTSIVVLNMPIIKILLERGKFDFSSTLLTSTALLFYSIGMIGFGLQEILNKAFYAFHNTKTPMMISVIGMLINIILSFILVKYMGIGGLALSASIASLFIAALLIYRFMSVIPGYIRKDTVINVTKTLVSSLVMGIFIWLIYSTFNVNAYSTFLEVLPSLLTSILVGVITYILIASLLKVEEIYILYGIIKSKFSRNI